MACCAALERLTYSSFEVFICENGGPAAFAILQNMLPETLSRGQSIHYVLAPGNLGYAGGVNFAMNINQAANCWWILNPDARPQPDALTAMIARLSAGNCDAVGGVLYHENNVVQAYGGRWRGWLARSESIGIGARLDDPVIAEAIERSMNYLLGASMLVTQEFMRSVGPMREDYFLYCEEVEWFLRALQRGMRLGFAPQSLVEHAQGGTTGSASAIRERPKLPIYLDERNKLNVVRDTTPLRLPVAIFAALVLLTLRYLKQGALRSWWYALSGWWAGVRGQRGIPDWLADTHR